jgi:hypothetical protein
MPSNWGCTDLQYFQWQQKSSNQLQTLRKPVQSKGLMNMHPYISVKVMQQGLTVEFYNSVGRMRDRAMNLTRTAGDVV